MLSLQQVQHIAKLARLQLSEQELALYQHDLSAILDFFGQLKRAKIGKVKPMRNPLGLTNVMRKDQPRQDDFAVQGQRLVDAAPAKTARHVKVGSVFK